MAMNNSLAKVHPELISEWSEKNLPLTPDDITFGSNKKVWWRGACGHEWQTSVKARSNGEKCPICSGARVIAGINDLATLKEIKVMGASVLARLKKQAKETGINYQTCIQLFAQEEFLHKLEMSRYAENLVLKGGMFL